MMIGRFSRSSISGTRRLRLTPLRPQLVFGELLLLKRWESDRLTFVVPYPIRLFRIHPSMSGVVGVNQFMRKPNGGRLSLPGLGRSNNREVGIVSNGCVRARAGAPDYSLFPRLISPLKQLTSGDGRPIVVGPRLVH